jgi:hypothetical protein
MDIHPFHAATVFSFINNILKERRLTRPKRPAIAPQEIV